MRADQPWQGCHRIRKSAQGQRCRHAADLLSTSRRDRFLREQWLKQGQSLSNDDHFSCHSDLFSTLTNVKLRGGPLEFEGSAAGQRRIAKRAGRFERGGSGGRAYDSRSDESHPEDANKVNIAQRKAIRMSSR
jgi:hypothetical protein